jgi:hypothetical protein
MNVNTGILTNNGTIIATAITAQNTSGSFTLEGTGTYNTSGSNGNVDFAAQTSITFGGSGSALDATVTPGSGQLQIQTPELIAAHSNSPAIIDNTGTGGTSIAPSSGTALTFANDGSAATLEINGQPLTFTETNITVTQNTTLSSDHAVTMTLTGGGTLTNNGTVQSGSGTAIIVQEIDGDILTLAGTTGTFTPGTGNLLIEDTSTSVTLSNSLDWTVSANNFSILTPTLIGPGLTHTATITASAGTAQLSSGTAGGVVEVQAGTGSSGTTTINLNGSSLTNGTADLQFTIDHNVLLQNASGGITMSLISGGTFTNSGTIATTAGGGAITVQGTNGPFTLSGTGTYDTSANNGIVEFTATNGAINFGGASGLNATINPGSGALQINAATLRAGGSNSPDIVNNIGSGGTTITTGGGTLFKVTNDGTGSGAQLEINGQPVTITAQEVEVLSPGGLITTLSSDHAITINTSQVLNSGDIIGTSITVQNTTGSIQLQGAGTYDTSASNGNVTFAAQTSITFADTAPGTNATVNTGTGALQIQTPTLIIGNGGSGTVTLDNTGSGGTSITAGSGSTLTIQNGGTASELDLNGAPITLTANNISVGSNFTLSSISGTTGGTFNFESSGNITVSGTIKADGSTGNGGSILFTPQSGGSTLTVLNNGDIEAKSISGTGATALTGNVGFNGNQNGTISVTGSGEIYGGGYVDFGYLDTSTLLVIPPLITILPQTGNSYIYDAPYGTSGHIVINQNIDPIAVNVSAYIPPTPPTPTPTPSSSSSLSFFQQLLQFYELIVIPQQLLSQQNGIELRNSQLGTRVATDYTPYTILPQDVPLQGEIKMDQVEMVGQALFAANEFNATQLNNLANLGILLGPKTTGTFCDLIKGFVLFMPTNAVSVETREGLVNIPKGAHVWIMETGADAAIYDLHDTLFTGPVKVTVNKKVLTMAPGNEILLTRNPTAAFEELNPGRALGYRLIRSSDMGDGIRAFVCNFSIPNGLQNVPAMHRLVNSNSPAERKAARKMLKNAAIISDLDPHDAPEYKTAP